MVAGSKLFPLAMDLLTQGWPVIGLLLAALVLVPIEKAMAVRPQSLLRAEWRTDLAYLFVGYLLVQLVRFAVFASAATIAATLAIPGVRATIASLPVWLQFLLALFCADLSQALLHRAYHHIPLLWRYHCVHHSSRQLDWLAGSRMHLAETALNRVVVLLPLIALGFSSPAVYAYAIVGSIQALLVHANVKLDFGWLEYMLVTPRYHHWHHARQRDCIDVNYAIHLPVVDLLMGTFRRPPRGEWPDEYGVMELETVPRGFWPQTWMPLAPKQTYADFVGRRHDAR